MCEVCDLNEADVDMTRDEKALKEWRRIQRDLNTPSGAFKVEGTLTWDPTPATYRPELD